MSDAIAYGLREDYAGTVTQFATQAEKDAGEGTEVPRFLGGVVHVGGNGEVLDVAKALEEGDGVIVVDLDEADPRLIDRLDNFTALKRVKVPDGRTGPDAITGDYGERTTDDLARELVRRGHPGGSKLHKDELVGVLEELDEHPAPDGTAVKTILEAAAEREQSGGDGEDGENPDTAGDGAHPQEA